MHYYRCADGHVFHLPMLNRLLSLHLGASRLGQCPVDHRWTRITRVSANELTEEQLESARRGGGN